MRPDPEIRRFLESLPTIATGHDADLKVETTLVRIWLSRATNADQRGLAGQVELEIRVWATGEKDDPIVWEARNTPLARQFANDALRVVGFAGRVKL